MLYKNIPDDATLAKVMRIRRFWDIVAALSFMVKGHYSNAMAVFKARRQFLERFHRYDEMREENKSKSKQPVISEQFQNSILMEYFLFRHRTFSKLGW